MFRRQLPPVSFKLLIALGLFSSLSIAQVATFTVTNLADNGPGSLLQAINIAQHTTTTYQRSVLDNRVKDGDERYVNSTSIQALTPSLYVCDTFGNLGIVDTFTGKVTIIGSIGVVITDIAFFNDKL